MSKRGRKITAVARPPQPDRELGWIKVIIALATFCGMILSWKLWVSTRLFPLAPATDLLPAIGTPFDYLWFLALLALLLGIAVVRKAARLIFVFLGLAILWSLWDQTRWQPWFFQYLCMLAAIGFFTQRKLAVDGSQAALNCCRFIIVCLYIWSALQKMNVNFVRETWPAMVGSLPAPGQVLFNVLPAPVIPVVELFLGVGLLTRSCRNACVMLLVAMHGVILVVLVSGGENSVVWPWNVAMPLLVWILFWNKKEIGPGTILVGRNAFHAGISVLLGVMPALSLLGWWDSYLSSALYSGNTKQAVVYVTPGAIARLPRSVHPHIWQRSSPFFLDLNRWCYEELNVPLYPEARVYREITGKLCQYPGLASGQMQLEIKGRPHPLTGERTSDYYYCEQLSEGD